jgi:hypothetical protein
LKQIKLQVAGQERRIAELEAKVACSKGKNRKVKPPVQHLPFNTDGAGSACQTVARGSAASLANDTGNPVSSFPDQEGQTPVSQPGRIRKRRKSRRKSFKSGNVQKSDSGGPGPHGLPNVRTVGENRRVVPKPGGTQLAILMDSASVPPATGDQRAATHDSVGAAARIMKYTGLYAQKTPLNRAPCVAGVDPMALLQFMIIVEI